MRRALSLLATLVFLGGCQAGNEASDAPAARPGGVADSRPGRIILFSADTVRADRVSGYGDVATTPNLRKIAAAGVLFRDFYAASTYTLPSHMSLFSGLDVAEHGLFDMSARIGRQVKTLAEVLRESGYYTKGIHEGGWVEGRFGFARGFDEYEESPRSVVGSSLWGILVWMREIGDRPYFLFLHTYKAHHPWGGFDRYRNEHPERGLPSEEEIEELRRRYPVEERGGKTAPLEIPGELRQTCTLFNQLVDQPIEALGCGDEFLSQEFNETPNFQMDRAALIAGYDEEIRQIDRAIGQIRETLIALGQWEDTLLIFTSDHGEAFFEHGLFQHGFVPFDEVLKVPLIISYPNLLRGAPAHVAEGLAWHLDLMPTVLGLAGVPYPGRRRGLDLTGVMLGRETIPEDRAVHPAVLRCCLHQRPLRRVVVAGGLKYIEGHAYFGDDRGYLFDLENSPKERTNLRASRPGQFALLASRASEYASRLEACPPVHPETGEPLFGRPGEKITPVRLSEQQRARLEALGYVE